MVENVADSASHARSANKHLTNKNNLKRGGNLEIADEDLDDFFHKNCITVLKLFCYVRGYAIFFH